MQQDSDAIAQSELEIDACAEPPRRAKSEDFEELRRVGIEINGCVYTDKKTGSNRYRVNWVPWKEAVGRVVIASTIPEDAAEGFLLEYANCGELRFEIFALQHLGMRYGGQHRIWLKKPVHKRLCFDEADLAALIDHHFERFA